MAQDTLSSALADAVAESHAPGAVAYVGTIEACEFFEAAGLRQSTPTSEPATKDTIYDLASVSKAVATTTAALLLYENRQLVLDKPVAEYVPVPAFQAISVRQLLTHTAGLPAWIPLYKQASSMTEALQLIAQEELRYPPGTRRQYSDLGFMILGRVLEMAASDRLDAFCAKQIFEPLGMKDTGYNPPAGRASRCAPTEQCPWRNKLLRGEPHDENAYAVGGVSGHAGLFSTAEDLARFCRGLLGGKLLREQTLDEALRLGQAPVYPWQGLGWALDPWASSSAGYLPAREAFGHPGFTGSCLWMDRKRGFFAILLSNTCHPTRSAANGGVLRRTFFDAIAKQYYPDASSTHSGLDRLMYEDFKPLRNKRAALLTHHAAVDQLGRPISDVFALAPEVQLRYIYSPEHGLRGQAEAGEAVPSEQGGAPIISLMGKRKKPSAEELSGIDYFVIDLQDIGSRYYTYASTMKDCMEACREAGTPVLVLDRPNPIGGEIMEGPIAEKTDSPVCWGAVPVRHGLTMGEIATLFAASAGPGKRLELSINALDKWPRARLFGQCGLPWIPPSPNIPTPDTALVYVGTCLFEGTNVSEGRGTEAPFELVGAPWLDAARVISALAAPDIQGFRLEAATFTPISMPGKAAHPRYEDTSCQGVRIHITDPISARPFRMAVALIAAMRQIHPKDFLFERPGWFDTLAGTQAVRLGIEQGEPACALVERLEMGLAPFKEITPRNYT